MRRAKRWTLRQRAIALCVVVGVLLTTLGGVAVWAAQSSRSQLDTVLDKAGPLRSAGEALLSALVDQEAGVRGYALTGSPADLAAYERGVAAEKRLATEIEQRLGPKDVAIRRQLGVVRAEAARWRNAVAEPVISAVRSAGPESGQALITDAARQQFEAVRSSVATLQAQILALRNGAADQARKAGDTLAVLLVIAAVVIVTAGIALLVLLDRLAARPVTDLAAQVRLVARGEYDRQIVSEGPPELAGLARDVDSMRRQIAADLSEVREARTRIEWVNSQLQKQAEELIRSNRDLEQFAYVASHDLQEPLRKVASFCQLLQRRYAGQLDERADQYIAFAVDGAQRMQRLINDLLAFSRIGRITSGFDDVDLNAVMDQVAQQLDSAREYAAGAITWSELPVVLGEEPLLTNLLANLISNSLKFRRTDEPPKVHISGRQVDGEWEISCRDNGIGIEPEFADKVFVIFQRLHSKDAFPGTGIGLAIAKKIVEYHGGRIWVDPEYTDGTAITFTLPVPVEQATVDGVAESAEETPTGDGSTEHGSIEDGPADAETSAPAKETVP